jgi:hypothetical protein
MSDSTWDLSDGLPDDFDGLITDCQFTYDQRYNNGQSCVCILTLQTDEYDEQTVFLSIGKDWEPADKLTKARYTGDKKARISKQSAFGIFIARAGELVGVGLRTRGNPEEAKTWVGLNFHWGRENYVDFQKTERSRLLPNTLIGQGSAVAASNGHAEVPILPAKIKTALMRVAAESDTHEAFVDKAMGIDGVTDEMRGAILSTQDGSIWATMNS